MGILFASLEPCSMLLHPAQWDGDFVYCITELHYPLAPKWEAPAKKAPVGESELGYLFLRFFFFELLSVGKGTFSNMKLYFWSDNPILQPKLLGSLVITPLLVPLDLGLEFPIPGSFPPILPTSFQMAPS